MITTYIPMEDTALTAQYWVLGKIAVLFEEYTKLMAMLILENGDVTVVDIWLY